MKKILLLFFLPLLLTSCEKDESAKKVDDSEYFVVRLHNSGKAFKINYFIYTPKSGNPDTVAIESQTDPFEYKVTPSKGDKFEWSITARSSPSEMIFEVKDRVMAIRTITPDQNRNLEVGSYTVEN